MAEVNIENNFCKYLKNYIEERLKYEKKGYISRLAKQLGVTQGFLSNVIAERRSGKEAWRRSVALILGLDYEEMIGITSKKTKAVASSSVINFPFVQRKTLSAEEIKREEMHKRLDEIYESKHSVIISAIESNLVAFHEAVLNRQEVEKVKEDNLSLLKRIERLEGSG